MSADYTVKSVREGKVYERNEHGKVLQAFYIDFTQPDGKAAMGVYWRREQGNAPKVGESYHGEITEGDYGPRFKLVKQQGGFKGGEKSPQVQAQIIRQHGQEMALRALAIQYGSLKAEDKLQMEDFIRGWADWFDADVYAAGQRAMESSSSGSGASGASTNAPSAGVSQEAAPLPSATQQSDKPSLKQLEFLEKLAKENGIQDTDLGILMEWANQTLTPGREGTCWQVCEALKSEGVPEAERLKETSQNWSKQQLGLPADTEGLGTVVDEDSDVPF